MLKKIGMKLEELKKKLYRPGAKFEERPVKPEIFEPGQKREEIKIEGWEEIENKQLPFFSKKHLIWAGLGLLVIFLVIVGTLIWQSYFSFDKNKVKLEILGPERIVSGDEVTYTVKYKNESRIKLKNIKLFFYFPEESLPLNGEDLIQSVDCPDLGPGQSAQQQFQARVLGLKEENKKAGVKLIYQPANISAYFENRAEFHTLIISIPLVLDFDLPERAVSGQSVRLSLEYSNQSQAAFSDLWLKLEYPPGFVFVSSEPKPLERDNLWLIGDLMAGEEDKIFIQGTLKGEEGEAKSFQAQLGTREKGKFIIYNQVVEALEISLPPLAISQIVNGQTDYIGRAGQTLEYQIDYQNTTQLGIRGVIITARLEGQALDLSSLKLKNGSYDGANQTITWNPGNLPALEFLAPGQKGQIKFSIQIKKPLPIQNYSDKNFIITSTAKIDSPHVPLSLRDIQIGSQNKIETKIASQLTLQAKGYFHENLIGNSGPLPPRVGQTTTYTIVWQLVNTANDLEGVKVEAILPPHVQWMDRISPADLDLKYDSLTGRVIWSVGHLPAATGLLMPVKQAAFQVAIRPSLADLGDLVELIGQSKASGQDTFVDLELTSSDKSIKTDCPDDPTIRRRDGIVVE